MRKFVIGLLLASVAASPALAQDRGGQGWRGRDNAQRQEVRDEPQAPRERRADDGERQRAQVQARQQVEARQQADARQQVSREQRGNFDRSRFDRGDRGQANVDPARVAQMRADYEARRQGADRRGTYSDAQQQQRIRQAEAQRNWSGDRNRGDRNWSRDGNWSGRNGDYRQRDGDRQARSRWANGGWNRDWRNDRRHDWRSYRDNHRSLFRLGVYFDPFGYGYRSFNIGYRLQPVYFGQRYWIDPAMYGLPFPPPGTTWVRYWNDAVLVDTFNGEVIDVVHNFFW